MDFMKFSGNVDDGARNVYILVVFPESKGPLPFDFPQIKDITTMYVLRYYRWK